MPCNTHSSVESDAYTDGYNFTNIIGWDLTLQRDGRDRRETGRKDGTKRDREMWRVGMEGKG